MKDELDEIEAVIGSPTAAPGTALPYSNLSPSEIDALLIKLR